MTLVSAMKQVVEDWWSEEIHLDLLGTNPPENIKIIMEWIMKIDKKQFNCISGKWDSI